MLERLVVKGRLVGPTTVELAEPVDAPAGITDVEVSFDQPSAGHSERIQALIAHLESLPPGNRTREDIDRQIKEERDSWE